MANEVVHNETDERYEIHVDGVVAGFAQYRPTDDPDVRVFTHTEIDDAYEGQGLASRLIQGALDDVRASGGRIVARCPFVRSYIEKHPEYQDLVDQECLDYLERPRDRA